MEDVENVKKRLEPFGYTCVTSEDADAIELRCSAEVEAFDRDKISRIDIYFPKREDLVNIEIYTPLSFAPDPEQIHKITAFGGGRNITVYDGYFVGVEFRDGARKSAPAIMADIIRERRKPLVLPRRTVKVI
jgi:hypothetical protein